MSGVAVLTLLLGSVLAAVTPSQAAEAAPTAVRAAAGTPEPARVVFLEDFQNVPTTVAGPAQAYQIGSGGRTAYVSNYPGYEGHNYTGSPGWINANRCNGVILSQASATTPDWARTGSASAPQYACGLDDGVQSWSFVRLLALAMGQQFGGGTSNFVYTSFSECNHTTTGGGSCDTVSAGETNGVMWQTVTPIPLPGPNRYMTFAVDTAAICGSASQNPKYQFAYQVPGSSTWTSLGQPVDACSANQNSNTKHYERSYRLGPTGDTGIDFQSFNGQSRTVALNSMSSDAAVRLAGGLLSVKMYNTTTATMGNDGSFDNVRALDATPKLDKTFSPAVISDGQTSTLRFTVTNTDELNAKTGWNFTDSLPAGLRATGVNSTTCLASDGATGSRATVTAAQGAREVVVQGSLGKGMTHCTIDVGVKAWNDSLGTGVGVYTNGPDNFKDPGTGTPACWDDITYGLCGLDAPGEATLTVNPVVDLSITKDVSSAQYTAGQQLTYTVTVSNAASTAQKPISTAKNVAISDAIPARVTNATWTCAAGPGATCGASGSGTIDDTVTIPPGGSVVYTVTGNVAADDMGVDDIVNTARAVPPGTMTFPPAPGSQDPEIEYTVVDEDCKPGVGCEATVTSERSELAVTKSADPVSGTTVGKGQPVIYTVAFDYTGTGSAEVNYTDDLRGVLDDATFVRIVDDGGLTVTGPGDTGVMRITGTVFADTAVVYEVVVKDDDLGDFLLRNLVVEGSEPPGSGAPCVPGMCTEHPVRYLYVEKVGEGEGGRLDGAQFVLRADDGDQPGDVLDTPALTRVDEGLFITGGIEPGVYWLEEQQAPEGFQLLAAPVQFEVAEDGTVTLLDPGAHGSQVEVSPAEDGMSTVTVTDRRAFEMPLTGGTGALAFGICGGVLIAAAAGYLVVRRRTSGTFRTQTREAGM